MPLITPQMMEEYKKIHLALFNVQIEDDEAYDKAYKLFRICQLAFQTKEEDMPEEVKVLIKQSQSAPRSDAYMKSEV